MKHEEGMHALDVFDDLSQMSGMEFSVYLAVLFITTYTVFMAYLSSRGVIFS